MAEFGGIHMERGPESGDPPDAPFLDAARGHVRKRLSELATQPMWSDGDYVRRLLINEAPELRRQNDPIGALLSWQFDQKRGREAGVLPDDELHRERRLLLLGNAGSGKSRILGFAFRRAAERFLREDGAPMPFFAELRLLAGHSTTIEEVLDDRNGSYFGRALREHPGGCALFLDGLDEMRPEPRLCITDLEHVLTRCGDQLATTIVTCRRTARDSEWLSHSAVKFSVYSADHLDDAAYAQILPRPEQRQEFRQRGRSLGTSELLETPFDGFYLAREFAAGRPLPTSRRKCIDQRVDAMLAGTAADGRRGLAPPSGRLRSLAVQAACVATFAKLDFSAQDLANELHAPQAPSTPPSPGELSSLLDRPLFVKGDDGRFHFVHQLYQEYLTAEALAPISLRKQRQLLRMPGDGTERVHVPFRGVAITLAEVNDRYREHLQACEPLLSGLAEHPLLSVDETEDLCRRIIDAGIAQDRMPWVGIPPRGENPLDALRRHRPRDVVFLVRPYVSSPDGFARQWGASVAELWGGAPALNEVLSRVARNQNETATLRRTAVEAIARTKDEAAIRGLCELFDDSEDDVRAAILDAYSDIVSPSPSELFSKLHGGRRNRRAHGILEGAVYRCCMMFSAEELLEGFDAARAQREQLDDLWPSVLGALYERAHCLNFYDIPPSTVIDSWEHDELCELGDVTPSLLACEHPPLLERIWRHLMDLLFTEEGEFSIHRTAQCLARGVGGRVLDLLPSSSAGLSKSQERFIRFVLVKMLEANPTEEMLRRAHARAPELASHLFLQPPRKNPAQDDKLDEKREQLAALTSGGGSAGERASSICEHLLSRIRAQARKALLDELRAMDSDLWKRCILQLLDGENWFYDTESVIQYLIDKESDLYAARCLSRLERQDFDRLSAHELVHYVDHFKPSGYEKALKAYCQRHAFKAVESSEDDKDATAFKALLLLMATNDAWAWSEFQRRVKEGRVPTADDQLSFPQPLTLTLDPGRLKALADWYAHVRQCDRSDYFSRSYQLQPFILNTLASLDRQGTIRELKRLRQTQADPNVRWLSYRIEDLERGLPQQSWRPGELLDFINRAHLGAVHCERDLFEWSREGLERIKEGLERRAEQVAGFWNVDPKTKSRVPKTETDCQNVLWPILRSELERALAVGIEERFIGQDRCDLLLEIPRPSASPFRVVVELKVARQGYGAGDLIEPVANQLVDQYMTPTQAAHGIFVVLWFKGDAFPYPTKWASKEEFERALDNKCREVERVRSVTLAPYVIDMTTRWRGQQTSQGANREGSPGPRKRRKSSEATTPSGVSSSRKRTDNASGTRSKGSKGSR